MIPQILTITDESVADVTIMQFALQNGIETSQLFDIKPEKDELIVEQIHQLQKDIQISFTKKVLVVLRMVDASSSEVQNSLLKCLEEDSERIQFLLLVKSFSRLLPTILSRCTVVQQPSSKHDSKTVEHYDELFSLKNNSDSTKEDSIAKIDAFIEFSKLKDSHILHHILTMRKLIIDNNMNPVLALDNILIFLSKTSTMSV